MTALGALVVSGALMAVVLQGRESGRGSGDDEEPARAGAHAARPDDGARARWDFEWPVDYGGPVWITLDASDGVQRTVTITWGAWQRRLVHQSRDERSYLFAKGPGSSVPITVEVDPAALVTFGSGEPPPDAEDINAGWIPNT